MKHTTTTPPRNPFDLYIELRTKQAECLISIWFLKEKEKRLGAEIKAGRYEKQLTENLGMKALRILKQFDTPAQLIVLKLNDEGKSQNAIVDALRKLHVTPRTKLFVNETVQKYNGLKLGKRTPDALEKSRTRTKTGEATAPAQIDNNESLKADRDEIVRAYQKAKPDDREAFLTAYLWLEADLARRDRLKKGNEMPKKRTD